MLDVCFLKLFLTLFFSSLPSTAFPENCLVPHVCWVCPLCPCVPVPDELREKKKQAFMKNTAVPPLPPLPVALALALPLALALICLCPLGFSRWSQPVSARVVPAGPEAKERRAGEAGCGAQGARTTSPRGGGGVQPFAAGLRGRGAGEAGGGPCGVPQRAAVPAQVQGTVQGTAPDVLPGRLLADKVERKKVCPLPSSSLPSAFLCL